MTEEKKLTGYPSIDRPWDRKGTKLRIPNTSFNLIIVRPKYAMEVEMVKAAVA